MRKLMPLNGSIIKILHFRFYQPMTKRSNCGNLDLRQRELTKGLVFKGRASPSQNQKSLRKIGREFVGSITLCQRSEIRMVCPCLQMEKTSFPQMKRVSAYTISNKRWLHFN
jgi:hypothetical protein